MTQLLDRPVDAPASPVPPTQPPPAAEPPGPPAASPRPAPMLRPALSMSLAMLGAAVMMGGSFAGAAPRPFAAVAGVAGVSLAVFTARSSRPWLAQVVSIGAISGLALAAALSSGVDSVGQLGGALGRAGTEGRTLPVPLAFSAEWRFLLVAVVAAAGYGAGWLATDLRRPRLGLLVSLVLVVFSAIAQPASVQTADAIGAFALLALAIAVLFRDTDPSSGLQLSRAFELRRAGRASVVVAVVVAALVGLSRADILFPNPAYDPSRSSQIPTSAAASAVTDRLLFTVAAPPGQPLGGPWRISVLDSYDGSDWRLPPYASGQVAGVGGGSTLDPSLTGSVTASFRVASLDGSGLPTPVRPARLVVAGAPLEFDRLSGALRLTAGEQASGISYTVTSEAPPTDAQLAAAVPLQDAAATAAGPAPPEVAALLRGAPAAGWARADWVRQQLAAKVTVKGTAGPQSMPPARVVDMLRGGRTVTPFELVAAEALLERWAGLPARIGYGYENTKRAGDGSVAVHPRDAAAWMEMNFRGLGWFPVTGGTAQPAPAASPGGGNAGGGGGGGGAAQVIGPDIAISLFVPLDQVTPVPDYEQIRAIALTVGLLLLLGATVWVLWPLPYKSFKRARRRSRARAAGSRAMIAVAYAELRELAIDLGDTRHTETPLSYLERVQPDPEHTELAWLVTRVLWGDLEPGPDEVLAAQRLSASLRRRLARGQLPSLRALAAVSRLSLRNPYWPELEEVPARAVA